MPRQRSRRPLTTLPVLLVLSATAGAQTLTSTTDIVALDTGGEQRMDLDAGTRWAGASYFLAASASGTSPGFLFGPITVPLNIDPYLTWFVATGANNGIVQGSVGQLDSSGRATATFRVPRGQSATLAGLRLHHAYVVFDSSQAPRAVSGPLAVLLAATATSIDTPVGGSLVGTNTARVTGTVGSALRGRTGLRVDVNGVQATLSGNGSRYAAEVPLQTGSNGLRVTASAAGLREVQSVRVTHMPVAANNVVVDGGYAYASAGGAGFAAVKLDSRATAIVALPQGVDGVHDVAVSGNLLFALDAVAPGNLMVYSIQNPLQPKLVAGPRGVPVGPFSGVSASGGRIVVSGGTSLLTVLTHDMAGQLRSSTATIDLGIGQPDVLLAAGGGEAYVSTDFASPQPRGGRFGITILTLATPPTKPTVRARLGLPGAGFRSQGPGNFALESAVVGNLVVTAHSGGLAVIDPARGALNTTLNVGFAGFNVDALGTTAAVVGGRSLALVDFQNSSTPVVGKPQTVPGSGTLTGVALHSTAIVLASNQGGLIVLPR